MKKGLKKYLAAILLAVLIAGIQSPEPVRAAGASVTFGSEAYEAKSNDDFPVGVYIKCDEGIGEFKVELEYDSEKLEYISGADSEQDGILTLEGNLDREQIKYRLIFHTIDNGAAELKVKSASIEGADEAEGTELTLADPVVVTVQEDDEEPLEGEDADDEASGNENSSGGASENERENAFHPEEITFTDIPLAGMAEAEGKNYYVVDLSAYEPREADWNYLKASLELGQQEYACLTDKDKRVQFLYLMDEEENMSLYAYSQEKGHLYPCNAFHMNGEKFYLMSPYVAATWPDGLTLDLIQSESIVYAMDTSGQCDFYKISTGNKLLLWDEDEGQSALQKQTNKLLLILGIAMLVMLLTVILTLLLNRGRKQKKPVKNDIKDRKNAQQITQRESHQPAEQPLQSELVQNVISMPEEVSRTNYSSSGRDILIISVQNVTMKFKIAMSNVSGIKEYAIQLLKKQISYRELLALDDVSFNIYKGEVVGIIGTNGSGKSTLLKIVSGALKPTSGKVLVNRKKIQLLTLGTGFDMELTAKENVYLNGAIIGYSKEFIDNHYDEIVQFAELENFMEEKVKNFSSGMVSRLGFAIATVGEAAEILILDEVLSVGDEFFRQKSLARIKEMIHGGSTVLMVSHSLGTIVENCTKVVWIEKGVLKMVGEPKVVCGAYKRMREK